MFEFHEMIENCKCALYVHHKHICVGLKRLNICISLFVEQPEANFKKKDPGHRQTSKYGICDLFGVRTYVSRERINHLSDFGKQKQILVTTCTLTHTRSIFTTLRRKCDLRNVHVANAC